MRLPNWTALPSEDQTRFRTAVNLFLAQEPLTSNLNSVSIPLPSTSPASCMTGLLSVCFPLTLSSTSVSDMMSSRGCKGSAWQLHLSCCPRILGHFLQIDEAQTAPCSKTGKNGFMGEAEQRKFATARHISWMLCQKRADNWEWVSGNTFQDPP